MINPEIACHYCGSVVVLLEPQYVRKYEKMALRQLSCGAYEFKSQASHPLIIFHIGYLTPQHQKEHQSLQRKA